MTLRWTEDEYTRYTGLALPVQAAPPAPVSEEVFQAALIKVARDAGFLVYHTYRSTKSAEGFPDVVLAPGPTIVHKGHPLYVCELKTEMGIVSQAQQAWLAALGQCSGVVAEVWRPSGLEEICRKLNT